ncbi:MAG: glycosyltransferase family 4 protein [Actinomycetota bacterium]|nr:glycosyltransferase family 4 protein [Actinomycetota bacterium]
MKIVFVTRGAAPRTGGIQAHLDRLAGRLAASGNDVTVFASRIDDQPFNRLNTLPAAQRFDEFEQDGVTTKPLPLNFATRARMSALVLSRVPAADRLFGYHRLRKMTLPMVVNALAPKLKEAIRGADVVHAMGGEPQAVAACSAADALGIPFVITPFAHPGHWGDDEINLRLYRAAHAVVALVSGERDWLRENGVASGKIEVIGVPAPEVPAAVPTVAAEGRNVLCLGVKRRYKYKLLLDALPYLPDQSVRFAFVGPSTSEWVEDAAAHRDPRIIERGKVDDSQKWGWLNACEALCLPSVSEIMPVSILEAWQIGRPVVVASGRWTADLVEDGQDGIIAQPEPKALATAIEKVLADPQRAREMGEAGKRKVTAKYAAAAVSAAHLRLYESLVGAKG